MRLQESGEMYLETILVLSQQLEHVRSLDVAEHMGYSKPSVSRAVGLLKRAGYLLMDPTLSRFFISIGVDEETAVEDACKVEHYISDATFERIKAFTLKNQS